MSLFPASPWREQVVPFWKISVTKFFICFFNGLVCLFMKYAFIDGSLWESWKQQQAKQPLIYGPYLLVVETKNQAINNRVINLMVINAVQTR